MTKKIMRIIYLAAILLLAVLCQLQSQNMVSTGLIKQHDFEFFELLTKDVLESSRIYPGQFISETYGSNNTGGTLIRPGGRHSYPAFWIRDYAMALECGFVFPEEQRHMLILTASTQCDQPWITKNGGLVPFGAIADHIRIDDGRPIYYPGTYDYDEQGHGGTPPYCDQFYFIHMAYHYVKTTNDSKILSDEINGVTLMDRLEMAFRVPPSDLENHIVRTTENFRGVDFGFRDMIVITGNLLFPSILKYRAANELTELYELNKNQDKANIYRQIASILKEAIPEVFYLDGMLLASTGWSSQPDVWGTALAVYFNVLEKEQALAVCKRLTNEYHKGTLAYKGNIRHILVTDDHDENTAWEKLLGPVTKGVYQNGAYWGTPTGWVVYAIAQVDFDAAKKMVSEFIEDLRENDYRKGDNYGAPYECIHPPDYKAHPVYLTTVACPYAAIKKFETDKTGLHQ